MAEKKTNKDRNQISFEIDDPMLQRRFNAKRSLEGRQQKEVMISLVRWYVDEGEQPPNAGSAETPGETPNGGARRIPLEFAKKLGDARVQAQEVAAKLEALEKQANASGVDVSFEQAKGATGKITDPGAEPEGSDSTKRRGGKRHTG